jgi:hypothetical protein
MEAFLPLYAFVKERVKAREHIFIYHCHLKLFGKEVEFPTLRGSSRFTLKLASDDVCFLLRDE